jgi:subtilisin family serine protease
MLNTSKPILLGVALAFLSSGLPIVTQAKGLENTTRLSSSSISATALQQIQALQEKKASLTPTQRKIDIHLRHAQEQANLAMVLNAPAEVMSSGPPKLRSFVEVDEDGTTLVDIKAQVTPQLLEDIAAQGGTIVSSVEQYNAIRARVPLEKMEILAEFQDIQFIGPAIKALTNKVNTSEGDKAHHAESARNTCGVDGTGVKIGVLSDSVDYLSDVQASGDLPSVTVLEDAPGNSGEGTAMLEIVHDLAPGAELYFATAWNGPASFANNIKKLRDAGCSVIVDDISYFNESPFQDDIISQAVNEVTADGVLYFSSAGNSGNLNDGESGVWEGDFKGIMHPSWGALVHDFGGGDFTNEVTKKAPYVVTLSWSDPLGASTNDYDLYLLDETGSGIVDYSENWQNGANDPFEIMGYALPGEQIVIVKYLGEDRFLHLTTNRGRLEYGTDGQISGHPAAERAFAVAAVDAMGNATAFDGGESVEFFSSDGPRRVFYEVDGTPITPGNFSATGGKVRLKPDIAAADGVMTATHNYFNPFYGTSAAAPHAAAIAGLLLSANLTPAQVRDKLINTAFDIEAPGWDRDSGAGIVMAHDCSIYGVNDGGLNNSQNFTINPNNNFTVKPLGPTYPGYDIEGMDIHPQTGELYATSGDDSKQGHPPGHLYKVNKNNGELTPIGSTTFGEVSAISFRKTVQDGSAEFTLWGWADGEGVIQINTDTGAGTMKTPSPLRIEDITWSNDGQFLYGVEGTLVHKYEYATNDVIPAICNNFPSEVEAIDMLPDGHLLFALHDEGDTSIHSFNIDNCSIGVSVEIQHPVDSSIETPYSDIEGITWYLWTSTD